MWSNVVTMLLLTVTRVFVVTSIISDWIIILQTAKTSFPFCIFNYLHLHLLITFFSHSNPFINGTEMINHQELSFGWKIWATLEKPNINLYFYSHNCHGFNNDGFIQLLRKFTARLTAQNPDMQISVLDHC